MPYDFYKLNWCDSVAGHTYNPEMGLSANEVKILESPYDVSIHLPANCTQVSILNSPKLQDGLPTGPG